MPGSLSMANRWPLDRFFTSFYRSYAGFVQVFGQVFMQVSVSYHGSYTAFERFYLGFIQVLCWSYTGFMDRILYKILQAIIGFVLLFMGCIQALFSFMQVLHRFLDRFYIGFYELAQVVHGFIQVCPGFTWVLWRFYIGFWIQFYIRFYTLSYVLYSFYRCLQVLSRFYTGLWTHFYIDFYTLSYVPDIFYRCLQVLFRFYADFIQIHHRFNIRFYIF